MRTGENEIQQDGAFPVLDAAHGGKVKVQHEEKHAAKETGHAHRDAVVAGVRVVVEDAEQTLAADVDVALVDDAAEHHDGENLQVDTHLSVPIYEIGSVKKTPKNNNNPSRLTIFYPGINIR